jgi:heterodisulfide reductase subunit B
MHYDGTVRVRHFLDIVVNDVGEEVVRKHVKRDLSALRVACYSGCQFSRPFQDLDHPEFPALMDRLCGWLGAAVVPFPLAAKCCGGMSMTTRPEIGRVLSGKILRVAKQRDADCIATACPLCQINLEAYQDKLSETAKADCHVPVLYFTQLLGIAFGLSGRQLALKDSLTPVEELVAVKVPQQ